MTPSSASKKEALTLLGDAQAHLRIMPEKTLSILLEHEHKLGHLPTAKQIEWYLDMLRASKAIRDKAQMEAAINKLLTYQEEDAIQPYFADILTDMGVWMMRSGHISEAKLVYICGLEHAIGRKKKLLLMRNLAVLEHVKGNLTKAEEVYHLVLELARIEGNQTLESSMLNNLGMVSMAQKKFEQAEDQFMGALNINQMSKRRSGEIINGLNLLNAFLRLDNKSMFERLYPRIKRLLTKHPKTHQSTALNFMYQVHRQRKGEVLSKIERQALVDFNQNTTDISARKMLHQYGEEMGLDAPPPQAFSAVPYQGNLLAQIKSCHWQKEENISYPRLLQTAIKAEPY